MQTSNGQAQTPSKSSRADVVRRMKLLLTAIRSSDPDVKAKAADDFEEFGETILRRFVQGIRGQGRTQRPADSTREPFALKVGRPTPQILNGQEVYTEVICERPRIQVVRNFLDDDDASSLISLALPRLRRSQSFTELSDDLVNDVRTSWSADFPTTENATTLKIAERAAALCHSTVDRLESLHITRYEPGQFFAPHFDFYPPSIANVQSRLSNGGQRLKTLLVYLNNIDPSDLGGATIFPQLNLAVKCEQGSGILWDNIDASGELDYLTQHGGIAPEMSTKFVLSIWVREHVISANGKPSWQSHSL